MKTTRQKTQAELTLDDMRDLIRTRARYQGRVLARAIINEEVPAYEAEFIAKLQAGVLAAPADPKSIGEGK